MKELDAIESAYQAAVENLYRVLSESLIFAKGDAAEEAKAKNAFKKGLDFNKKVYDTAKAILEAQG